MNMIIEGILLFALLYPIIMSFVWIFGALFYEIRLRRSKKKMEEPDFEEKITIVVPVYNEERFIEELLTRNINVINKYYPNAEFLVINDCSKDNTKEILDKFDVYDNVIIVNLKENLGKAGVLNYALDIIETDYFICVDSDTLIYPDALSVINKEIYNEKDSRVAAYTGSLSVNQQDDNHTVLKVQKLEYRSIIGTIKRSQDFFFKNLMTVSGALTCYKVAALRAIGGFSTENATEDIEVTWHLTSVGYRSLFISEFCAEIFSPNNGNELIKQRTRWNLGGLQTAKKYRNLLYKKGFYSAKFFHFERLVSILWIYAFLITTFIIMSSLFFGYPRNINVGDVVFPTAILIITSMLLQLVSYKFDKNCKEYFDEFIMLILYYPLLYWLVQPSGYFSSMWKYYFSRSDKGKWRSHKKSNVRLRSIFSAIFDISVYFLLISLWKIVLQALIPLFNPSMLTIYYLILVFWMGLALIFYQYFIAPKYSTFGENLFGIRSTRRRNTFQGFFNPVSVVIIANTVLNTYITINIISFDEFGPAVAYIAEHISDGGIINPTLYPFFVFIIVERAINIDKIILRNKLRRV